MVATSSKGPIYLTNRTAMETDWHCGMAYFWSQLYNNKGIVPANQAAFYKVGGDLHEDTELFAKGWGLDEVLATLPNPEEYEGDVMLIEPCLRRWGWLIAFWTFIWPQLMEKYEIVAIEKELVLERGPLWMGVKPDLILRNRKTGRLVYLEYKTFGGQATRFAAHWPFAIQIHLGIKAIEEELGEKVEFGQVLGFYKGYEREGKLRHPYTWAYTDYIGSWGTEWRSGWGLELIHNKPGGIRDWVPELGEEFMRTQFVWSAPVFLNERLVTNVMSQRLRREEEIAEIKSRMASDPTFVPEAFFEQRTKHCKPAFGPACPYILPCHNGEANRNPYGAGFVERVPHHELELVMEGEL
jgi:hypothetical protein